MSKNIFTPKEVHAIQLALQEQMHTIRRGLEDPRLNDFAIESGKDLLATTHQALIKSIAAYGQFSPLDTGDPSEEDIKKYTKQ